MSKVENLDVGPYRRAVGSMTLPGSKSISNRTLLLAALCKDQTTVKGLLKSDDTDVMINALRQLGATVAERDDEVVINGADAFSVTDYHHSQRARVYILPGNTLDVRLCDRLDVLHIVVVVIEG